MIGHVPPTYTPYSVVLSLKKERAESVRFVLVRVPVYVKSSPPFVFRFEVPSPPSAERVEFEMLRFVSVNAMFPPSPPVGFVLEFPPSAIIEPMYE